MNVGQIEDAIACGDMSAPMVFTKMQEHIDTLRQRLAEVEAQNNILRGADYHQAGIQQEKEIIALEAKLALAEQDARRYRWLRDNCLTNECLDSSVDAAIASQGKK